MTSTQPSRRIAKADFHPALVLRAAGILLILAACGTESTVATAPVDSVPAPDLRSQAFKLTIDTRSGRVEVTPPSSGIAKVDGLSLSLLGSDAIALTAGNCVLTVIPNQSKKRCTMDIQIDNGLLSTDLVTPTTFPRPPQGTRGIMVFPLTAATPAGVEVVPSPDWDLGPANFFNDVSCSGSGKTDCFRYELFPSPLYAGESTPIRQVGFDIPASASSVTVYVVVAADLRGNPVQTVTLNAVSQLCGDISFLVDPPGVTLGLSLLTVGFEIVGFCSFPNSLPAGARVVNATIRLFSVEEPILRILVQRVNWGNTLEPSDALLPTLNDVGRLVTADPDYSFSESRWFAANASLAVQAAFNEQLTNFQFRLILDPGTAVDFMNFHGSGSSAVNLRPNLIVQYTLP